MSIRSIFVNVFNVIFMIIFLQELPKRVLRLSANHSVAVELSLVDAFQMNTFSLKGHLFYTYLLVNIYLNGGN